MFRSMFCGLCCMMNAVMQDEGDARDMWGSCLLSARDLLAFIPVNVVVVDRLHCPFVFLRVYVLDHTWLCFR